MRNSSLWAVEVQHPSKTDGVQISCDGATKHHVWRWKSAFSVGLLSDVKSRVSAGHIGGEPRSGFPDQCQTTVEAAVTVQTFCLCFDLARHHAATEKSWCKTGHAHCCGEAGDAICHWRKALLKRRRKRLTYGCLLMMFMAQQNKNME